jgi:nucleotide-binding universal stress UspA family protein
MGTQGQTGAARLFFGSTLARVLRETAVPVLALGPESSGLCRHEPGGPAIQIDQVVAAVGLHAGTDHIVRLAASVAATQYCPLVLVHAVPPARGVAHWRELLDAEHQQRLACANERLQALAGHPELRSIRTRTVLRVGQPEDVIAEVGGEQPHTLIVLGLRSARPAFGLQPGTTAYRVLCTSKAPVLAAPLNAVCAGDTRQ